MKLEFLGSGSPDCPLIRIYGFDRPAVQRLMALFRALSDGSKQHIGLHEQLGVEAIHACQLDLHLGTRDVGLEQTGPKAFECTLTSEGWAELADMTEPFCETGDFRGHYQWLNVDGKVSLLLSQTGRW